MDTTPTTIGTPFAPQVLVPVLIGCMTVNLYPIVNHTMVVHKRAHTFQINKTALASQALNLRIMLDELGVHLNLSASVKGMIEEWLQFFQDSWFTFQLLQILSFHNKTGGQVNNTTTPTNPAVLLLVQDGPLDQCHKAIKFVRVQLNLDYRQLTNVNPPGPTVLQATYYIKLPQTLHGLVNGNGGNYNLLTFDGPDNLRTLTPDKVKGQLLDITLQGYPLDLLPPSFNIRAARTDLTAL